MTRAAAALVWLTAVIAAALSRDAAAAALAAFVVATSVPVGALMLRFTVKLTGGERQDGVVAALEPALGAMPLVWLWLLALAVAVVVKPFAASAPNFYFSTPAILVRLVFIGAAWSWLGFRARHDFSQSLAAMALLFHALALFSLSLDWSFWLSARGAPQNLAMSLACWQFLAGAAMALFATRGDQRLRHAYVGALAGGVIAAIYFAFIAYFTAWYGDVPERTIWFRERLVGAGAWTPALAAIFGIASLFVTGARRSRLCAILAMIALAFEIAWLLNPAPTILAAAAAMLALAGAGLFSLARPGQPA